MIGDWRGICFSFFAWEVWGAEGWCYPVVLYLSFSSSPFSGIRLYLSAISWPSLNSVGDVVQSNDSKLPPTSLDIVSPIIPPKLSGTVATSKGGRELAMEVCRENCGWLKTENREQNPEKKESPKELTEFCVFDREGNEGFASYFMSIVIFFNPPSFFYWRLKVFLCLDPVWAISEYASDCALMLILSFFRGRVLRSRLFDPILTLFVWAIDSEIIRMMRVWLSDDSSKGGSMFFSGYPRTNWIMARCILDRAMMNIFNVLMNGFWTSRRRVFHFSSFGIVI